MENSNFFVREDNQVNEEKPPPRTCPRCNSDNTKFCYYNNYSVTQPRYNCKSCRRYWTHGGALRNIPVGGNGRKIKRTRIYRPFVSQVVSVEIQQVNHYQRSLHIQDTNEFVGTFGGSSSSVVAVGNYFGCLPVIHGDMVLAIPNIRPLINRLDFSYGSLHQNYQNVGSNDFIGNPLINQSIGRHVDNYSGYRIYLEDQNNPNHSFNNTMNMNHNASTSGSRRSSGMNIIRNAYVFNPPIIWRSMVFRH